MLFCTSQLFTVYMCTMWNAGGCTIGSCSFVFLYCDPVAWRMWPASVKARVPAVVDHPCQLFSPPPSTWFCCFRTDHCACFTVTPLQALALRWVTSTAFSLFTFWLCCFLQIAAFHLVNKQVTYSPPWCILIFARVAALWPGFFCIAAYLLVFRCATFACNASLGRFYSYS